MATGNPAPTSGSHPHIGFEEAFQQLLRRISEKAADHPEASELIQFFCAASREFFLCAGVYFWRRSSGDELVGELAAGKLASQFAGSRLLPQEDPLSDEVLRSRRTAFRNRLLPSALPGLRDLNAHALMMAPVVVLHEVIGTISFLHDSDFSFDEDSASRATILVGQLGSLLEASRLGEVSRADNSEARRRAQSAAEPAVTPTAHPDCDSVAEALADRLRVLLGTRLVSVLLRREGPFELRAVSAETPQLATAFRSRHDRQTVQFAADLAHRAVSAGDAISVSVSGEQHSLGSIIPAGILLAVPFSTARSQGAILVYPRSTAAYSPEEKTLVVAMASFAAVAMAHAELCSAAQRQAQELQQLLEISSELSSCSDLDRCLQVCAVRFADFLSFGRSFVALFDQDRFQVHYMVNRSQPRRVADIFPEGMVTRAIRSREVFWSDDLVQEAGVNPEVITRYGAQQLLAVPLLKADGSLLGMLGALERSDGLGISREDMRRARALGAQMSPMIEFARSRHHSGAEHHRSGILVELTGEIDGLLRLPDFAHKFLDRVIEWAAARSGALVLRHEGKFATVAFRPLPESSADEAASPAVFAEDDLVCEIPQQTSLEIIAAAASPRPTPPRAEESPLLPHRLAQALEGLAAKRRDSVLSASAVELLGADLASRLNWKDCTVVRLPGAHDELAGLLTFSGRSHPLTSDDRALLEALAGHVATALDNARLFSQVDQANRHWMEIFDAITDLIVVHDEDEKVLRVNRSLAAMIGVAPSELIGIHMRALLALTSESSLYACPFCRPGGDDTDEYVHPALDRTYLVSTSRVPSASGEGRQTIHVLKDISDRREAERRYRELLDNIQEGLFFSTPEGRFIEVNDALVGMLGYSSREELLQVDIPSQLYFSPEHRILNSKQMEEHGFMRNVEATLRRKNGTPAYVLINAFGMYDNARRLIQIRGLMLDVTGLHTFQSELQRERDFSGKILDHTQSLILVADTSGLISYANRRWFEAGFQQRDLLGHPLLQLAAPGFALQLSDAIQTVLRGNQVDNLEIQIARGNGNVSHFSVNLSPMRDDRGHIASIVAVMTDITDSSELRDKLVHAEKLAAVGQLVSGVAHEVNNPLTAILGFADLLLENPEVPENARKDLRVILQEAQRTKTIVQNLLSFARQMPPQRSLIQLNLILRRTIQLRSYDFNSHGIDIVEHLDEGMPDINGDAHQLQQVFLNILNNAYDAVRDIGRTARIEIMTTKVGSGVEASFRDNGPGVTHPDRIFDPFFTTKEVGKGTGLGLSICYGIVKEHGGEILCHNNTDGQGATFIVRFPAAPHSASLGVAAGVLQP